METCTYGSEGDAWEPTIAIWKGTGYLPYQTFGQSGSTNGDNSSVGKVKERIDHSQTIPKTKRSYQIGRNTGRDLRNLGSKKRNKLEEK
ncbi:hypothetical protein IUJ58_25780 [Priestia aryabhattai]|uniref:hypothetical protein n=1 Tax=Priestia aryabhattai TaxID=412384 RepID=UPI001C0CA385|nr:hypothetical protein [Priestia aryabhattai]MBU3569203.1 hypothetical protein [Priestia aryabhattai]WDL87308.1 hypothetical protein IUJ58_25780 [Priestia aryabhattai]